MSRSRRESAAPAGSGAGERLRSATDRCKRLFVEPALKCSTDIVEPEVDLSAEPEPVESWVRPRLRTDDLAGRPIVADAPESRDASDRRGGTGGTGSLGGSGRPDIRIASDLADMPRILVAQLGAGPCRGTGAFSVALAGHLAALTARTGALIASDLVIGRRRSVPMLRRERERPTLAAVLPELSMRPINDVVSAVSASFATLAGDRSRTVVPFLHVLPLDLRPADALCAQRYNGVVLMTAGVRRSYVDLVAGDCAPAIDGEVVVVNCGASARDDAPSGFVLPSRAWHRGFGHGATEFSRVAGAVAESLVLR